MERLFKKAFRKVKEGKTFIQTQRVTLSKAISSP